MGFADELADLQIDADEAVALRRQLALAEAAFRSIPASRRAEALAVLAAFASTPAAVDEAQARRARRERERLFEEAQLSGVDSSRRTREPA